MLNLCSLKAIQRTAAVLLLLSSNLVRGEVVLGPRLASRLDAHEGQTLIAELNCVACHSASTATAAQLASRHSPNLGTNGLRLTPQYLRAFLADPARAKPGTTMPSVVEHLSAVERAEAVESLVHYLISQQADGPAVGTSAEDYEIKRGQLLYHSVGCVACHEPQTTPDLAGPNADPSLQGAHSVPLGDLARKTTADQLARFLADPAHVRPSGRMPSLQLNAGEAKSLAIYLLREQAAGWNDPSKRARVAGLKYQYFEGSFSAPADFDTKTPIETGTIETFHVNARKQDQNFGFRFSGLISVPADGDYTFFLNSDDGSHLHLNGQLLIDNGGDHGPQEKAGRVKLAAGDHPILVTFYNNGGGFEFRLRWSGPGFRRQEIPSTALSHLGQPMVPLDSVEFAVDREKAARGGQLFVSLGCASCHQVSGSPLAKSGTNARALAQLQEGNGGCLAANPAGPAPRFHLSPAQREAMQTALRERTFEKAPTPAAQIDQTLSQLNCLACHSRNEKGGPASARAAYFQTAGEIDLGDEGRIPPHLSAVGAKLRSTWMREVLTNGGRVRPYMATRMPQFGAAQVGHLPALFETADLPEPGTAPEITQRDAKFGRRLAGVGGLVCISCHTVGPHKSLGIPAMNLSTMAHRLRYDWFRRYLIDPSSLRPGTRMPSFFPGGEAANREILQGNTGAQIQALWAYLSSQPETDLPPGLIQGQREIVAETEPAIYRNFIAGAGPRAIGVGYPEKVNLAFDADQQRLALIWHGSFIDSSRHSSGRGEGFEPPLGNNIVKMPDGPPFALLADPAAAWPAAAGKPAGFKMGGYSLDARRRPSFFYEWAGLRIEEHFEPVMGEIDASFRRTVKISGQPAGQLYFRAAIGDLVARAEGYVWNQKILLKFPGAKPILREAAGQGGQKELIVPVVFSGETASWVQEIIW